MNLTEYYSKRTDDLEKELREIKNKLAIISSARLVIALLLVTVLVIGFTKTFSPALIFAILMGLAIFGSMVKRHLKVKSQEKRLITLIAINQNELLALQMDVSGNGDGKEFQDYNLPNAFDLDLFGNRSLYQHISRCASPEGASHLAHIFKKPLHLESEIIERQNVLKELADKPEWRQSFQAIGKINQLKKEVDGSLESWFAEKGIFIKQFSWLRPILWISPAICITLIVLYGLGLISSLWPTLYFFVQLTLVGKNLKKINRFHMGLSRKHKALERYASLLEHIDSESFLNPELKLVHAKSKEGAKAIRLLKRRMNLLDSRLNMMMALILNGVFLWDIRRVLAIEEWKENYLSKTKNWIHIIAQMDAFNSMGNYVFNHPEFAWPHCDEEILISAQNLGHPFLPADKRICNDFKLLPKGQLVLLSGANMSGKSTFLRTIGLNMVMAEMGLPVCADEFALKPIPVYTSMRINDSLQDSESYFYSELKRLKFLIDHIKAGNEIMVLLDEILRGTNSNDKHQGSIGLIEQLLELQTSGIIASHDITLSNLAEKHPKKILNRSFEVENQKGELVFDYKLRNGVCQNLNASYLMKKMGITR